MNAIGYQGIFEAAGHKLNEIGGIMLWKINSAFPSVIWQVYDWFLMPNAGYYFMQNALEPVHIQFNPMDQKVLTINRTYQSISGLIAETDLFGLDAKSLFHEEKSISLSATDIKEITSLSSVMAETKGVNFVVLNLKNSSGKIVSHNVYWLSKDGNYKTLNEMQKTNVDVNVSNSINDKSETSWIVQITNNSDKLAFFIRPQLMVGEEEVLPSYWTANYFTLAPSETATVTVSCPVIQLNGKKPGIKISGWNVNEQELYLK
jgi:hypothetical protein